MKLKLFFVVIPIVLNLMLMGRTSSIRSPSLMDFAKKVFEFQNEKSGFKLLDPYPGPSKQTVQPYPGPGSFPTSTLYPTQPVLVTPGPRPTIVPPTFPTPSYAPTKTK